jgi:hypothetical protein
MREPTGLSRSATAPFSGPINAFEDVDEFVAQLHHDRARVRDRTVRGIKDRRPQAIGRYEQQRVLAGYLVDLADGEIGRVELVYFCGTLLGGERDTAVIVRADDAVAKLRATARQYGLIYRTGPLVLKRPTRSRGR